MQATSLLGLLLVIGGLANPASADYQLSGRIVRVADGDTVVLRHGELQLSRIRLSGIDAPEIAHGEGKPSQAFGRQSKESLSSLLQDKDVIAECSGKDRYGRDVCRLLVAGADANLEQVKRGMAWVFRRYTNDPEYYSAEKKAVSSRTGLWAGESPIAPWDWRGKQR